MSSGTCGLALLSRAAIQLDVWDSCVWRVRNGWPCCRLSGARPIVGTGRGVHLSSHLETRRVIVCDEILLDPVPCLECCPLRTLSVSCVESSLLGASGHPAGGDPAPPESWVGLSCTASQEATLLPQHGGLRLSEGGKFNFSRLMVLERYF